MVTDYSDVKLETKDLILKKAEFEDWKTIYYNLWRHKESAKYMLWQPTETDEDAKDRMKRTIAFEEKPENKYALFVYLKKTGEAIGFAGMREDRYCTWTGICAKRLRETDTYGTS